MTVMMTLSDFSPIISLRSTYHQLQSQTAINLGRSPVDKSDRQKKPQHQTLPVAVPLYQEHPVQLGQSPTLTPLRQHHPLLRLSDPHHPPLLQPQTVLLESGPE